MPTISRFGHIFSHHEYHRSKLNEFAAISEMFFFYQKLHILLYISFILYYKTKDSLFTTPPIDRIRRSTKFSASCWRPSVFKGQGILGFQKGRGCGGDDRSWTHQRKGLFKTKWVMKLRNTEQDKSNRKRSACIFECNFLTKLLTDDDQTSSHQTFTGFRMRRPAPIKHGHLDEPDIVFAIHQLDNVLLPSTMRIEFLHSHEVVFRCESADHLTSIAIR